MLNSTTACPLAALLLRCCSCSSYSIHQYAAVRGGSYNCVHPGGGAVHIVGNESYLAVMLLYLYPPPRIKTYRRSRIISYLQQYSTPPGPVSKGRYDDPRTAAARKKGRPRDCCGCRRSGVETAVSSRALGSGKQSYTGYCCSMLLVLAWHPLRCGVLELSEPVPGVCYHANNGGKPRGCFLILSSIIFLNNENGCIITE